MVLESLDSLKYLINEDSTLIDKINEILGTPEAHYICLGIAVTGFIAYLAAFCYYADRMTP